MKPRGPRRPFSTRIPGCTRSSGPAASYTVSSDPKEIFLPRPTTSATGRPSRLCSGPVTGNFYRVINGHRRSSPRSAWRRPTSPWPLRCRIVRPRSARESTRLRHRERTGTGTGTDGRPARVRQRDRDGYDSDRDRVRPRPGRVRRHDDDFDVVAHEHSTAYLLPWHQFAQEEGVQGEEGRPSEEGGRARETQKSSTSRRQAQGSRCQSSSARKRLSRSRRRTPLLPRNQRMWSIWPWKVFTSTFAARLGRKLEALTPA